MSFFFPRFREISLSLPFGKGLYVIGPGSSSHLARYMKQANFSSRVLLVADKTVATLHAGKIIALLSKQNISAELLEISGGEAGKSLETAQYLYRKFLDCGATRQTGVIALGGGVITDLVGFVASTFMRGLPLAFIPTTLLAQVDAAVGGKTGVNLENGKNLVGSFYHPRLILIDPDLLRTLPDRELQNGFPEVIKMAVLQGEKEFRGLEACSKNGKIPSGKDLDLLISSAALAKIAIVRKDPDERDRVGERIKLNLGHTFAHALEAATDYGKYSHGEAVSIGLAGACYLAEEVTRFSSSTTARLEKLLTRFGLPVRYRGVSPDQVFSCMASDKKKRETLRFVLPLRMGEVVLKEKVPESLVLNVLSKVRE